MMHILTYIYHMVKKICIENAKVFAFLGYHIEVSNSILKQAGACGFAYELIADTSYLGQNSREKLEAL